MSAPRPDASHQPHDHTVDPVRYAEQVRAFRVHAAVFAVSVVGIFLVNLLVNLTAGIAGDLSAWWSLWVLLGWGIGVAIHGAVVRLARPEPSPPGGS